MSDNSTEAGQPHPPTAEMREYWEALGRFIHHFARVETHISVNLWKLTRISIRIAQAVFSGVRMDAAASLINRVLDATNADPTARDEFQYIFTQLGHITKVRNDILHYGITSPSFEPGLHTSNRLVAYSEDKIRETPVSATILNQMTDDLITIELLLGRLHTTGWVPPDVQDTIYGPHSRGTWRYKPLAQASHPRRRRDPHPKRKRQP